MIPKEFEYYRATSVQEAVALLLQHGEDARLLAGGHSLLPMMKLRLAAPTVLIDISTISELKGIVSNGRLRIGAATTFRDILQSTAIPQVLAECVALIGDIQVRNRGTIGGSLAHADPAADVPAVVLALDATIQVVGPNGERIISADDFFVAMLTTALEQGEVITAISFPLPGTDEGAAYVKFSHPASRYAIVGAAAYLRLAEGRVRNCRVAITGAGVKAERQFETEQALLGQPPDAAAISAAAAQAGEGMEVLGDIHAGEDYRRAQIKVYARRALLEAARRAQGM